MTFDFIHETGMQDNHQTMGEHGLKSAFSLYRSFNINIYSLQAQERSYLSEALLDQFVGRIDETLFGLCV